MKAGTTTLYRDLMDNPAVFMSAEKEPGNLMSDVVCAAEGRRDYAQQFRRAEPDQICGEATTGYTKLPDVTGVPRRARRVLGENLKVIYLVREPVSRIISQHHHERSSGRIGCGILEAVRTCPRYINYSRYAMQIKPWLEELGPDHVLIIRFETYVNDRRGAITAVSQFLGVEPTCHQIAADTVYNKSEGKPLPKGSLGRIRASFLYRSMVRPMLRPRAREMLRTFLLPKSPRARELPSDETVRYIIERVVEDAEQLRAIMNRDAPLWDFEELLRRYDPSPQLPGHAPRETAES